LRFNVPLKSVTFGDDFGVLASAIHQFCHPLVEAAMPSDMKDRQGEQFLHPSWQLEILYTLKFPYSYAGKCTTLCYMPYIQPPLFLHNPAP
jgi:hypothetical protein